MTIDNIIWDKNTPKPQSILFCCTMNAIRSPMAEGVMKKLVGTSVYVDSAGVIESTRDDFMVEAMAEIDIDMSNHKGKTFESLEDSYYDLIVAMSPEAQHHAVELTRTMACEIWFWKILDPSIIEGSRQNKIAAYKDVRNQIQKNVEKLIEVCNLEKL